MGTTAATDRLPPLLERDPADLANRAPGVFRILHESWRAVLTTFDAATVSAIQASVWSVLVDDHGDTTGEGSAAFDDDLNALVEQFVDYLPDVDESLLDPISLRFGSENLRGVLEAVYVCDQLTRMWITHTALFGDRDNHPQAPSDLTGMSLRKAAAVWHDKVLELKHLDALTAEVMRLRAAFYHQCGTCMSVRLVEDDVALADADLVQAVYEDRADELAPRHRTALLYADIHMIDPQRLDERAVAQLRSTFTDDELLEMTIDMTAWNYQKVGVALKIDTPFRVGELSALHIAEDGRVTFGRALGSAVKHNPNARRLSE